MEFQLKFGVFLTLLSFFVSANAFSCVVPTKGKEFDNLIDIEWNKGESTFYIRFPPNADGQKFDNVTLGILKDENSFAGTSAPLQTFPDNGKLLTYVRSFDDLNVGLNISVWWQGENDVCPIIGKVKLTKK